MKIKWTEKIKNENVLKRIRAKREILNTIVRRVRMVVHNLRQPGMLALILEGMVEGKYCKGR